MTLSVSRRAQVVSHVRRAKEGHGHQAKTTDSPHLVARNLALFLPKRDRDVLEKYGLMHMLRREHAVEHGTANEHTFDRIANPHYIEFSGFEARAQLLDSEEGVTALIHDLDTALHHEN